MMLMRVLVLCVMLVSVAARRDIHSPVRHMGFIFRVVRATARHRTRNSRNLERDQQQRNNNGSEAAHVDSIAHRAGPKQPSR